MVGAADRWLTALTPARSPRSRSPCSTRGGATVHDLLVIGSNSAQGESGKVRYELSSDRQYLRICQGQSIGLNFSESMDPRQHVRVSPAPTPPVLPWQEDALAKQRAERPPTRLPQQGHPHYPPPAAILGSPHRFQGPFRVWSRRASSDRCQQRLRPTLVRCPESAHLPWR